MRSQISAGLLSLAVVISSAVHQICRLSAEPGVFSVVSPETRLTETQGSSIIPQIFQAPRPSETYAPGQAALERRATSGWVRVNMACVSLTYHLEQIICPGQSQTLSLNRIQLLQKCYFLLLCAKPESLIHLRNSFTPRVMLCSVCVCVLCVCDLRQQLVGKIGSNELLGRNRMLLLEQ